MDATSHLGLLVVFSAFVSIAFAVLMRDEPREQLTFGAKLFGTFIGSAVLFVLGFLGLRHAHKVEGTDTPAVETTKVPATV